MESIKKKKYITDKNGKKTDVILDVKTYEKILEDLEEFYLIKKYDSVKEKTDDEIKKGRYITLEEYQKKRSKRK